MAPAPTIVIGSRRRSVALSSLLPGSRLADNARLDHRRRAHRNARLPPFATGVAQPPQEQPAEDDNDEQEADQAGAAAQEDGQHVPAGAEGVAEPDVAADPDRLAEQIIGEELA